ncbi:uncharacterized protein [Littorina saxatilis]|uniref:uncharacterized protein n=1 Tax=Littorina saxatilis TaxID=31220 RepID=UPI0038B45F78
MKVNLYNVADGETFTYSLPLVIGDVDFLHGDSHLHVWLSSDPDNVLQWPVVEGCFKFLVQLEPGENIVNVRHENDLLQVRMVYSRRHFTHFVRPVYIVCADDDGHFQGPESTDCSPESAVQRIALGAQLIQSFTAEKMKEHGFGRVTFQLESHDGVRPVCHVFRSKLTLEQAYSMSGNDLWTHFGKELMTSGFTRRSKCKWYSFMSFTRYELPPEAELPKTHSEILKYTKGHTALGGGGLALFGTGNLHTWAPNLETLHAHLTDRRKINRRIFMDDSAYREYYWANYVTGLGASLHELGHTFDLAHTATGVMARGFDDLHKVFTVQRSRGSRASSVERQRYSSCSSGGSNISRTPSIASIASLEDGGGGGGGGGIAVPSVGGGGFSGGGSGSAVDIQQKRYKDVCYGSPYKRVFDGPGSRPSSSEQVYIAPPPLVVKVENAFKPVKSPSLTFSVKNYDGSETHRTISQDTQGELVTELTVSSDGSLVGSIAKERRPSSISTQSHSSASSLSPSDSTPSTLPNSPEDLTPAQILPNVHFCDAGAHWSRSSAVLLRFHRWFNSPDPNDPRKNPQLEGLNIKSDSGLRIVELRNDADGMVFHHWEFLSETPPTHFMLKRSRIKHVPENCSAVVALAEDSYGNIMKKRINLDKIL